MGAARSEAHDCTDPSARVWTATRSTTGADGRGLGPGAGGLPRDILRLQRLAGNAAVRNAVQPRSGPPSVQRSGPVDDAIGTHTAEAVAALTDQAIAKATAEQRFQLIDIVLPTGGDPLRRVWDSFGGGIEAAANSHPTQWEQSMTQHKEVMRQSREVKTLEAAFALDIRESPGPTCGRTISW